MTIAVLGATGRLGRMLQHHWTDTLWFGRAPGDLRGVDTLIDLRGIVPGKGDLAENVAIARNALDAALEQGIARVFLASTAAVYGRYPGPLTAEVSAPESPYGSAKRAMEEMAAAHPQAATCLRIGNVAGADAVLAGWRPGFQLDQLPDGRAPARSYIGPESLARVLRALCHAQDLPAIMNLAAPGALEMDALLNAANLPFLPRAATENTIARVELDTKPLEARVPFAPEESTSTTIVAQWRRIKDHL